MKSTRVEVLKFRVEVAFIKIMYYSYWTYLAILSAISFFIPLYCLYRTIFHKESFVDQNNQLYKRICESFPLDSYLYNRDRLEHEINVKLRDL